MKTLLIAELGSTHENDSRKLAELVAQCADAGATACKIQWWSDSIYLAAKRGFGPDEAKAYEAVRLRRELLDDFAALCQRHKVECMCTAYYTHDLETVSPYVTRFKVASLEARDITFLDAHLPYDKPIIISTGAMDEEELHRLIEWKCEHDDPRLSDDPARYHPISLLHCTAAYPCADRDANLGVIREYGLDGYSDHTANVSMGMHAVMAGAQIVEVHVRHFATMPSNPDFRHSLPCAELMAYRIGIEAAEKLLGSPVKRVLDCERPLRRDLTEAV